MIDEVTLFANLLNRLGRPYMVTGATAAIVYGQPRVTNDLDVVIALAAEDTTTLETLFPEAEFYLPPAEVIAVEAARERRGHFNIIHHESGYKADVYIANKDPLHQWALPLRQKIEWSGTGLWVAPPEYVILRKLEFFREGGSTKHLTDIRAMLAVTPIDIGEVSTKASERGLTEQWTTAREG